MKKPARKGRVTLALVAERAGVSVTTVSVILSGRAEWLKQFHPDTVVKVRKTAQELGYHSNLFATGLPGKSSALFTLVLHDLTDDATKVSRLGVHEGAMLSGVIRAATSRGLYPVAATSRGEADEDGLREVLRVMDGGVFGSIIRTPSSAMEKVLRDRQKQGYPIVVVFPVNIATWSANAIDVDNDAVGYTVGRLFRERGRKRWLLAQYERPNHPQRLRREGFLRFAEEAGIQVQTAVLPGEVTEATGADLVASRLARAKADAVYGLDYVLSVGSLLGCVRLGLKPGEDVDLVGCDCSAWHSVHLPQITCVDVSWLEVGALAVEQLTKMQQAGTSHFDTILLPPRIATGGTCPVTKKAAGSSA